MVTVDVPKIPYACYVEPIDNSIAEYESTVSALPNTEVKDVLQRLVKCVKAWLSLPVSVQRDNVTRLKIFHRGEERVIEIVGLDKEHIDTLWDVTPFPRECQPWKELFESLPDGKVSLGSQPVVGADGVTRIIEQFKLVDEAAFKLKKMAMHLLWFTQEISLDREPFTQDQLPA